MESIWMGISPSPTATRVIAMSGPGETILKAQLATDPKHPRALGTLLEAVALWQGLPVRAALCVGSRAGSCDSNLALRPRWNPLALTFEDDLCPGESQFAGGFRLLPVPQSCPGSLSRRLAARGCCLPPKRLRRLPRWPIFRGSMTRPVRSLSTLRSFPSRLPGRTATQDSLPAGGQPLLRRFVSGSGPS
jgi:hypothetical protein